MPKRNLLFLVVLTLTLAGCARVGNLSINNDAPLPSPTPSVSPAEALNNTPVPTPNSDVTQRDIVAVLSQRGDTTVAAAAIETAEMEKVLQEAGPFTVFIPDNAAFTTISTDTINTLLRSDQRPVLIKMLQYHIVRGRYTAADLKAGQVLTTLEGDTLTVDVADNVVGLKDTQGERVSIKSKDVSASNGVIHIITGVLVPEY